MPPVGRGITGSIAAVRTLFAADRASRIWKGQRLQEFRGGVPAKPFVGSAPCGMPAGYYNCRMPSRSTRKECAPDPAGERTLEMAVPRTGVSAGAVQYRCLDRNYWN
jgi:hypothetical protein